MSYGRNYYEGHKVAERYHAATELGEWLIEEMGKRFPDKSVKAREFIRRALLELERDATQYFKVKPWIPQEF